MRTCCKNETLRPETSDVNKATGHKAKAKAKARHVQGQAKAKARHVQGQTKAKATLLPYETKLKLVTSLTAQHHS